MVQLFLLYFLERFSCWCYLFLIFIDPPAHTNSGCIFVIEWLCEFSEKTFLQWVTFLYRKFTHTTCIRMHNCYPNNISSQSPLKVYFMYLTYIRDRKKKKKKEKKIRLMCKDYMCWIKEWNEKLIICYKMRKIRIQQWMAVLFVVILDGMTHLQCMRIVD